MLTSCSPGWISFLEKFYPELIPHASSCRSPMGMTSVLTKTYYAQSKGIDPKNVYMVAVMPCTAKKYEAAREEHRMEDGTPYTDAVLTTRELIWMIKSFGIDYWNLPQMEFWNIPSEEFDAPLGIATGAGDIFGTTGGVMEATLRTAYEKVTGKDCENLEFHDVRAVEGLREASIELGSRTINVGVANGLNNAKALLDKVTSGAKQFHVIEVMACPGGCIGGGGQPYVPHDGKILEAELLRLRGQALYSIDGQKQLRKSHENPAVLKLYEDFLGEIGGPKAHELLHTHYTAKLPRGIK
jgi:iron only hydrogenase large subunit-like protein